ncbi:MAG: S8 family serine peptidase [Kineosporiaceae bacterium]
MSARRTSALAGLTAVGLLAAAAALAPLAGATSAGTLAATPAAAQAPSRWIVRLAPGADLDATAAHGVTLVARQAALGTAVVSATPDAVARLRALPGVLAVTADLAVTPKSTTTTTTTEVVADTPAPNVNRIVGAVEAWKKGWTGAGVDVALLDTGVSPVAALKDSAKVVVGPDLSFESQNPELRHLDTHGHGTHIGSVIAGRESARSTGATYAADPTSFYGVAPDARLVSLKLADQQGVVDVSQMIAAIDWVVQHKNTNGMNIRVLNISFGVESPQSPQTDPLSYAAEVAWKNGIVVVASAGNEGGYVAGLSNPAYNPWVLAVGAADTKGTDTLADDAVAAFSARQGGNWGSRTVDVLAPGVNVVAPAVPGSVLADANPDQAVGTKYLRGSGTSQAAAVVSGAVADLLQARPTLSPDQVKALLTTTATKLSSAPSSAQGHGELDLARALGTAVPTTLQSQPLGNGKGSLESARSDFHITVGKAILLGEMDVMGRQWSGAITGPKTASKTMWGTDGSFNGGSWMVGTGFGYDTTTVAGRTWGGRTWSPRSWTGSMWAGFAWSGATWGGRTWNGTGWSGSTWLDPVVGAVSADSLWSGAGWKR